MTNIIFICHGNICRSPMAEFIFKDMLKQNNIQNISVCSAATSFEEIGNDMYPPAKRVLDAHNIIYTKRKARHFEKSEYDNYDYIIAMDGRNIKNLLNIIGKDKHNKIHLLLEYCNIQRDVDDPWYTGKFEKTYEDIYNGCKALLEHITGKSII